MKKFITQLFTLNSSFFCSQLFDVFCHKTISKELIKAFLCYLRSCGLFAHFSTIMAREKIPKGPFLKNYSISGKFIFFNDLIRKKQFKEAGIVSQLIFTDDTSSTYLLLSHSHLIFGSILYRISLKFVSASQDNINKKFTIKLKRGYFKDMELSVGRYLPKFILNEQLRQLLSSIIDLGAQKT